MKERFVYHVVTEQEMTLGQHIYFDELHHNGVYRRVYEKMDVVKDIYAHSEIYCADTMEHHIRVALRELALEKTRVQFYPDYPSRMSCLYVSEHLDEAEKWAELFVKWGRATYSIVKLKVIGNLFEGDANNCFDATLDEIENLNLARRYWEKQPNIAKEPPIKEILVDGDIEVVQIVKQIHANL